MKNTRTAAQLPDTQKRAAKNSAAQNTPPMVTVYDGGITEEIVHGRLDTKLNFLFARNWGSYPLKDGRYVYEECTGSKKSLHVKKKVYSGIRPDIFEFLTETDRNDTNGQRKAKDHADYSVRYEDGGEDENGDFHQSAMDKAAFQQWVNKETWDAAEDDPIYPDELLKQDFVPGENKVNNQRWQMRRQVIEQYIPNLSRKDREAITKHYGMGMTLEQAGAEEGLDKQAIWNRLDRDEKNLKEVFTRLGIAVPTDQELAREKAEASQRRDEMVRAEKKRKEEAAEQRAIRAEVNREYKTDMDVKPQKNQRYGEDEFLPDYDPENPADSISEDYDPYEDPMYKAALTEEEAEYAGLWDDEEESDSVEGADSQEDCYVDFRTDEDFEE